MLLERREDFFRPFRELQREIDRIFDDFFRVGPREVSGRFIPDVDIYETENSLVIEMEAPGLKKEDIKITVEDGILVISGEKKVERDEKKKNYMVVERCFGKFERAFNLPDYVDPEKIKAKYENGVLTITMPKKEEKKKKTIDVKIE
ncbi:MAG TPA: Hsp20/alpha crystallin family protein [Thermotoga sp.]|nr:Hsp20/alpha crystallin family protein [Thermotoga sp.]